MNRALHAEWTKLRTIAGPAWLLASVVVLTVAMGAAAVGAARCQNAACGLDPAKVSLLGIYLGQALIAVIGVLMLGNEYSTAMIRVSLTAMPRRVTLLSAKTAVLAGPVLAASALAVGGSILAGRLILPGHGFTVAHGYELGGSAQWRASFCAMVYLVLVALLSLGVTAMVRDSAAAIGIVLGLLYLFPIIAALVSDQHIQRHLEQVGPMSAGLDSMATTNLGSLPLTPWQGLGVTALWSGGALLLGGLLLRSRDA